MYWLLDTNLCLGVLKLPLDDMYFTYKMSNLKKFSKNEKKCSSRKFFKISH